MNLTISKAIEQNSVLHIIENKEQINYLGFNNQEIQYINSIFENKEQFVSINQYSKFIYILFIDEDNNENKRIEKLRRQVPQLYNSLKKHKTETITINNISEKKEYTIAVIEILDILNYKFDKYITKKEDLYYLINIEVVDNNITEEDLERIKIIAEGIKIIKDIINEPFNALNSLDLASKAVFYGQQGGYSTEVLSKKQIETLRMGGLLAVNKASNTPPTFSILEWKPQNAKNTQPIIFVGKGLVFDTGGYNLKTSNFMDDMKQDKAGGATVIGLMYIISKLNMPIYAIGLIPATDNVISATGTVTGDIIKMHNGTTVEVLNTDAEGRLILADALAYAQKHNPMLVIDLATLTGTATRSIDIIASALMCKIDNELKNKLIEASEQTNELLVEFPLWDDYAEQLKSKIADLKNIGGSNAGQITAAKFLEHFTNYPWIHLDIAPTAFYPKNYKYYNEGATAIPTKLIISFIEKILK